MSDLVFSIVEGIDSVEDSVRGRGVGTFYEYWMLRRRLWPLQLCLARSICPPYPLTTQSGRRRVRKGAADDEGVRKERPEGYVYLHKSRGQHLLTNQRILDSIVQKSNIKPTDTVLEIGPGTGNLTLKLLDAAAKVVAVEIDERMVEVLKKRTEEVGAEDRLKIFREDALKMDFPRFDLVVANIPYGISSPLVAKLLFWGNPFRCATLLLQKEFARRLVAEPGDSEFNRLAVNVKLFAEVEFVMNVSRGNFVPCPKVDSSVVTIRPKAETPNVDLLEWLAFTRTCFNTKNKTVGAILKQKRRVMELVRLSEEMGCGGGHVVGDRDTEFEDDEGEFEEGNCNSSAGSGMKVRLFREKIVRVLRSGGFEEERPWKMSNGRFLELLRLLNRAGIFFHNPAKPPGGRNANFAEACDPSL